MVIKPRKPLPNWGLRRLQGDLDHWLLLQLSLLVFVISAPLHAGVAMLCLWGSVFPFLTVPPLSSLIPFFFLLCSLFPLKQFLLQSLLVSLTLEFVPPNSIIFNSVIVLSSWYPRRLVSWPHSPLYLKRIFVFVFLIIVLSHFLILAVGKLNWKKKKGSWKKKRFQRYVLCSFFDFQSNLAVFKFALKLCSFCCCCSTIDHLITNTI